MGRFTLLDSKGKCGVDGTKSCEKRCETICVCLNLSGVGFAADVSCGLFPVVLSGLCLLVEWKGLIFEVIAILNSLMRGRFV